jgi:DNA polymerase/3'-5' exonuclease PolX
MKNKLIIDNFKKLIELIQIEINYKKKDTTLFYRLQSLKRSLYIIKNYQHLISSGNDLAHIKGIGQGTIDRIDEIIQTGSLIELVNYDKIIKKYKSTEIIIEDLMMVIGIGRYTALELISKYKIKSASELKKLSDQNKIKLNDKIKIGLKYLGKFYGMIPRSEIDLIYDYLQEKTDEFDRSMFITICGSYRRGLSTSSDIDILLSSVDIITMDEISNHLRLYIEYLHKIKFLVDDITDKNINTKYMGFGHLTTKHKIRRIDIRFIPLISYFTALLYFTGPYQLNKDMRYTAKKLGYKLNEYELINNNNEPIIVLSEQEIFHTLKLEYIKPIDR